jgi:hypothetical protein
MGFENKVRKAAGLVSADRADIDITVVEVADNVFHVSGNETFSRIDDDGELENYPMPVWELRVSESKATEIVDWQEEMLDGDGFRSLVEFLDAMRFV